MYNIVKKINNLKNEGIEDSIVLGFSLYMESIKKNHFFSNEVSFRKSGIILYYYDFFISIDNSISKYGLFFFTKHIHN